jgi:hypothetical protein
LTHVRNPSVYPVFSIKNIQSIKRAKLPPQIQDYRSIHHFFAIHRYPQKDIDKRSHAMALFIAGAWIFTHTQPEPWLNKN